MHGHGIRKTVGGGDAEDFQDGFSKFLRTIEYVNTDALGEQIGEADVYDNAKLNLPIASRAIPGS